MNRTTVGTNDLDLVTLRAKIYCAKICCNICRRSVAATVDEGGRSGKEGWAGVCKLSTGNNAKRTMESKRDRHETKKIYRAVNQSINHFKASTVHSVSG